MYCTTTVLIAINIVSVSHKKKKKKYRLFCCMWCLMFTFAKHLKLGLAKRVAKSGKCIHKAEQRTSENMKTAC